ncbi:MAG: hypothetical protein C0469_14240 [Cyanobacteria bacterium DS2.3.42]|nr:hypothetical protein [Cyanobacteria bacterium DS2.3.42]
MTFEQAGMVPKNGDQPSPFLFPQFGERPHSRFGPVTPSLPPEREPSPAPQEISSDPVKPAGKAPDTAPAFDVLNLMEDWESAYDKAKERWTNGLTEAGIDKALAGKELNERERTALKTIKDNFDDLANLDGDQMASLTKSDLKLFKVLLANTARDIEYYEKGQKFLSENKTKLDKNGDGKLNWYEIYSAKSNPEFKQSQLETITYLSDRYSNNLHYKDVGQTALLFSNYRDTSIPEQDFAPGNLGKIIDQNQSLAYSYKFADDYRNVAVGLAFGTSTLATKYIPMGFWAKTATLVGSLTVGAVGLKTVAEWQGPKQQDSQDERIKRLMTKVANFNY